MLTRASPETASEALPANGTGETSVWNGLDGGQSSASDGGVQSIRTVAAAVAEFPATFTAVPETTAPAVSLDCVAAAGQAAIPDRPSLQARLPAP